MTLDTLRSEIDALDADIVRLLSKRAAAAAHVGRTKREQGIVICDPLRETNVLKFAADNSTAPMDDAGIRSIYREIIAVCSRIQADLKDD
ncbi:MAG: chorismate mutase [Kiritimatiellae bacterium]|nr:chorismate mutase [Kiritimatiellia bacterium]